MQRRRCSGLGRTVAACIVAAAALPAAAAGATASAPTLDAVLERLARVAALYREEALSFTCDESILYSAGNSSAHHRYRYIYRFTDGKLHEWRELIDKSATGLPSTRRNASEPIDGLDGMLLRPYSWVFVFSNSNREVYRLALDGEARVLGTEALRVRFAAVAPFVKGVNEWDGTAFVDRRTYQPLRFEAYHTSDRAARATLYTTDFDVVENGMRFPGQVRVRSTGPLAVTQTYKRYRFFGVRTLEQIQQFVLPGD